MKLGAYGVLRVAMTLFPHGLDAWAATTSGSSRAARFFALLAVMELLRRAGSAGAEGFQIRHWLLQRQPYGFRMLGLLTLTHIGLSGAVLQMFSHGIIAGLLFAVVGRMVYDRTQPGIY